MREKNAAPMRGPNSRTVTDDLLAAVNHSFFASIDWSSLRQPRHQCTVGSIE